MDRSSVVSALTIAALIAQQGDGGDREDAALTAMVAARNAYKKGGLRRKLRAARLVGAWCRKYAKYGL